MPERQSILDRLAEHLRKELQIPKKGFARLVKEMELTEQYKFHSLALLCLHEASEKFITEPMALFQILAQHGKRKTIMLQDLSVVMYLVGAKR